MSRILNESFATSNDSTTRSDSGSTSDQEALPMFVFVLGTFHLLVTLAMNYL